MSPRPHIPSSRARRAPALAAAILAGLLVLGLGSCSIKRIAVKSVANSLTGGADVFASDDDPELIRDALPFALKTMESLLAVIPDHEGLLLAACKGYTQYSYAFIQSESDLLVNTDYARSQHLRGRAFRLFLRARGFGLRGLEKRYKGIGVQLPLDPQNAAARIRKRDLDMLYWTAASWGAAISLGKDQPEMLADLPVIRALIERGLALDEGYAGGALHEAMIVLEALPATMGGSIDRARGHFARAVELSRDTRPGPYVTLATSVSVLRQDRGEFRKLLEKSLTFDPDRDPAQRLSTIVLQRKARALLERQDEYFVEDAPAADSTQTQESP